MSQTYYNFRVSVTGDNSVRIQEWGEGLSPEEKPVGKFHRDKVFGNEEIGALIEAATHAALDDVDQVIRLGEALCEALLDERLLNAFIDSYKKHAQDKNQLFRFELDIDEQALPDVAALPWEFMCLPEQAGRVQLWFATAPKVIFSRRRALWDLAEPIQLGTEEKLRITLIISSPRGEAVVDYQPIEQALKDLVDDKPNQLELFVVNPAQFGAVDEVLRKHKPHIFHFIGHGRLHNEKNEEAGQLAFMNDMGRAKWINAREFSDLFTQHVPEIVVLQACEGGQLSSSKAFVGVASNVVQQNIPVVVAMQYEVTNDTAIEFVNRFYWELAEGCPVDLAAQLGRRAIANGSNLHRTRDFATPVLFMRVRDGYLFQQTSEETEQQQENAIRRVFEFNQTADLVDRGVLINLEAREVKNATEIKAEQKLGTVKNAKVINAKFKTL